MKNSGKILCFFVFFLPLGYPEAQEKPKLAVLPFGGLPQKEGEHYAELFIQSLSSLGSVEPLPRGAGALKNISEEFLFQSKGLTSQNKKAEPGQGLNAKYVLSGSVSSIEGRRILTLLILDIENIAAKTGIVRIVPERGFSPQDLEEPADVISSWLVLRESHDPLQRALAQRPGQRDMISIRKLIGRGLDAQDEKGQTSLMLAAKNGYEEIVPLLLDQGVEVNAQTSKGATALMYAAQDGYKKIVEILLKAGAEKSKESREGFTAHGLAMENGHYATAKLIKKYKNKGK